MNEKKFNDSESTSADSDCPVCERNLPDHNAAELIRCAVIELSKNNIKKMIFGQQDLTPTQMSSPSKGGHNYG